MGQNFHKIEAVRLEGGQPDRFFPVFFTPSLMEGERKELKLETERGGGGAQLTPGCEHDVTHFLSAKTVQQRRPLQNSVHRLYSSIFLHCGENNEDVLETWICSAICH